MIKLTIRHLSALRELARTQSFTQAAARLHTTQSNLSLAVQEAEHMLGARLFNRTTKRCSLTAIGLEFLPVIERVLADLQSGIENVKTQVQLQKGILSLGASALLTTRMIPDLLAVYRRNHPNIDLRIEDTATAEHVKLLRGGHIELALGMYSELDADLEQHPLLKVPLVLFAHNSLQTPKKMPWQKVMDKKLISIIRHSSVGQLIDRTFWQIHGRAYQPAIECHHWATVLSMTEALCGMCIAPANADQGNVYKNLVRIEIVEPIVSRTISIAHLRDHELSPAAQAFLTQLNNNPDFAG